MTTTTDRPTPQPASVQLGTVNARGEAVFLWGAGYELTARQLTYALAAHLAHYGDTLHVKVVDPLSAIDAHMRFDADLTGWTRDRTPHHVAVLLARAEHIARDYFGHQFPGIPW